MYQFCYWYCDLRAKINFFIICFSLLQQLRSGLAFFGLTGGWRGWSGEILFSFVSETEKKGEGEGKWSENAFLVRLRNSECDKTEK